MPKRAQLLYTLQRIDSRLTLKKRRYQEVQALMGESEALQQAREALKSAEEELSQWRGKLHDHELEVAGVHAKLQETEERLYGGKVTNPKELTDLQQEAAYLRRRQEALEEKEIGEMDTVDELTAKAAAAQEQYTVIESNWRQKNADLHQEYDHLRQEMGTLLAKRKSLSPHIGEKDMAEYDALRRLLKGVAVVAVKGTTCQVCHVEVPQRDLKRARDTNQILYCSGCERILYVQE
jgi:predicted  nucleic acid-binding Zn-ribbon protein